MKQLIIAIVSLAAATSLSAQSLYDNPNNAPYFGARLGLDITSTSGEANTFDNGVGFNLGAIYNIPIWKNLYFEPGLSIFYDTFGSDVFASNPGGDIIQIDGSIRNFGFRVPLAFGFNFDFTDDIRIAPFTGPQFNYNVTAKQHWNVANTTLYEGSLFGDKGFKHLDMQWIFGLGMTYQQNYYVAISGGVGITDAYKNGPSNFRRNNVNISVGYNF